jgi:adenosine deaminase
MQFMVQSRAFMPKKLSDLHMHLNGSFSLGFLEKTAVKNNVMESFQALLNLREQYAAFLKSNTSPDFLKDSIVLIWGQFTQIHNIIQSLDDVTAGTIDAIISSKAKYMEIRTRPKAMNEASWEDYVDAFINGLQQANDKCARGILSLDKTKDDLDRAFKLINRVEQEKNSTGLLVGIDFSGSPVDPRTLTGATLETVLKYALEKNIGIALHIGEAETATESADIDIILRVLKAWYEKNSQQDKNPLHGKVRLGHGIFLTAQQRALIKQLEIPIEICPTCHSKVNWWQQDTAHPVTQIYQHWSEPVISGTDDEIIFGANAEEENQTLLRILGYKM